MRGRPVGRGGGRPVGPQPSPHSSRGWRPHTVGVRAPLSGWRIAAPVLLCSARPAHTAPSQRPAALSPNTAMLRRSAPKGSAAPEVPSARQRQPGAAGPAVKPGRPAAVGPPNRHPPPRGRAGSGPARDEGQRGGGGDTPPTRRAVGPSSSDGTKRRRRERRGAARGDPGVPSTAQRPPRAEGCPGQGGQKQGSKQSPHPSDGGTSRSGNGAVSVLRSAATAASRQHSTAGLLCPAPPCPRRVVVCTCTDPPSLPAARRAPPGSSAGCPPA